MAGRGDPPEGTPEDIPGGDDEYRSVVFDESFVKAARIQEFSATERMGAEARAVRARPARNVVSRQAFALMMVVVLAFGAAVFMGMREPYSEPKSTVAAQLSITLVPLALEKGAEQRAGDPKRLFAQGPVAGYRTGAEGVILPTARNTRNFSERQVLQAVTAAKEYVVASSANPDVLSGRETGSVRRLLDPAQLAQFDRSLERPADDGQHAATGWMVRFDPGRVALADTGVRVNGSIEVREAASEALQVSTDHTFVYAVRATNGGPSGETVLFVVRREFQMRFDKTALRDSYVTLISSATEVGPQRCEVDGAKYFQPVLPGDGPSKQLPKAKGGPPGGTNPFDHDRPVAALCGVLSADS